MSVAIKVENLSKQYQLGKSSSGTLIETLKGNLDKILGSKKPVVKTSDTFWALKDVSFEVQKGDVVGIIGKNGAGKSTLLKILSRITEPTTGRIEINGRVSSLLEVGTGFHPELTGRENIYLNGAILGMKRTEIKIRFDDIVDFSGVGKFIDTPVKHYSSGMYVRLAFAVAAYLESEVLIVDEVLAVGDVEFQKKCLDKMEYIGREGRTVFFVSHNLFSLKKLCEKGILLDEGLIKLEGSISTVAAHYMEHLSYVYNDKQVYLQDGVQKDVFINNIKVNNENDIISVLINGVSNTKLSVLGIGIKIKTLDGLVLSNIPPKLSDFCIYNVESDFSCTFIFNEISKFLAQGYYYIDIWFSVPNIRMINTYENILKIEVEGIDLFNNGHVYEQDKFGYLPLLPKFLIGSK